MVSKDIFLRTCVNYINTCPHAGSNAEMPIETSTATFQPIGPTEYLNMFKIAGSHMHDAARRRLAPFQVCSQCRCCSGNTCKTMPCCYGINCNIPNKPYGYCAFQPKKCDCNPCATA